MPTELDPVDPLAGLEAWTYMARGRLFLRRYTGKHGEVAYEEVRGGQTFHLSPAERHLNSDKIRNPARDPFKNGTCVPVRLTSETPKADREAIESNPATLTDDQIVALFSTKKGQEDPLPEMLEKVENPIVLSRILELAEKADLPGSKIKLIRSRVEEVDPGEIGERRLIPAANEQDSPEIYGDVSGPGVATAGEV